MAISDGFKRCPGAKGAADKIEKFAKENANEKPDTADRLHPK